MDLLRLTCSELQHWGSSLKGSWNIQEGTEVSGTRASAGGTAFYQAEVLVEATVPFLSHPPHSQQEGAISSVSINLAKAICPALVIP